MSVALFAHAVRETLRVSVPTVLEQLVGRVRREVCDERLASYGKKIVERAAIELEVSGRDHLVDGEAYVVMSNHQSLYDIPVLFSVLPQPLRMVAKKEIFDVPIWGGAMRAARFVEVDRGNRAKAISSLSAAQQTIRDGISIWIAPEGTRSPTGELGRFKSGGFHLAKAAGARILPVTLIGTKDVLVARQLRGRRGQRVRVVIDAPIATTEHDRDELSALVRSTIARHLHAARG